MTTVSASQLSSAMAAEIFSLLGQSATYPFWSMIEEYESVKPGHDGLDGAGALRRFRTGRFVMLEEVLEVVPGSKLSYVLHSGFPLLDYRATTTLMPVEHGTRIEWTSTFRAKYRLTSWFWQAFMAWVLRRMVKGLAQAAENEKVRASILELARERSATKKIAV